MQLDSYLYNFDLIFGKYDYITLLPHNSGKHKTVHWKLPHKRDLSDETDVWDNIRGGTMVRWLALSFHNNKISGWPSVWMSVHVSL